MKAMVLAAGLGTRLRPLTLDRPKPLVELAGRPVIAYNLALLRRHGIREVIINLHHHGEALRAALGDGARFGLDIHYSPEDPLLDTGGAIKNAEALLAPDDFLVMNGDTVIDLRLDLLIAAHRERGATATLVVRHDAEQARYGLVEIDGDERVRRFLGKPAEWSSPLESYMFAGVHMLSSRVFQYMPDLRPVSITREVYPRMLADGEPLYGFPYAGFWCVIDTADDLARAERALASVPPLAFLRD